MERLKYTSNLINNRLRWPINLWIEIFGFNEMKYPDIPPRDLAKTFEYVFKYLIPEKDAKVLSYHYKDNLSLQDIANMKTDIGSSVRTVRSAIDRAIRSCRHIDRRNIIYSGLSKFLSDPNNVSYLEVDQLDLSEEVYTLLINNSINLVRDIIKLGKKKLMNIEGMTVEYIDEIDNELNKHHISFLPLKARNISYLNLPNKTYSLLYRNNIRTIGQLLKYTEKDLRSIDLIGDTTIKYIKTGLLEHGLKLSERK